MKLLQLKEKLTLFTLICFGLIYVFTFLGSLNDNEFLESIGVVFGVGFFIILLIRIIVGIIITISEKRWGYLFFKTVIIIIAGYFFIGIIQYFSDAILKSRAHYGTARIAYEVFELDNDFKNLDDSLIDNISIKTVLEKFEIIELKSDSGSVLCFIPKEGIHYYRNLCIDDKGYIRSYRSDTITTYEDCIELRITDSIQRVDSTLIFGCKIE